MFYANANLIPINKGFLTTYTPMTVKEKLRGNTLKVDIEKLN